MFKLMKMEKKRGEKRRKTTKIVKNKKEMVTVRVGTKLKIR